MSRWIGLAAALLLAGPAAAIEVECPGGMWYGDDVRNCPCCEICPDGTWRAEGDELCSPVVNSVWQSDPPVSDLVFPLIFGGATFFLYFVPFFVAKSRRHHQSDAILLTNIFLGWTVLGWIIAMIWAATATDDKRA